ncbi:hypothetical protein IAD21_00211 [Abditibacteriota bacterium]|nr:hypothetical protein IAD21_00211 [Abditibacteriota bacterium]
MHKNHSSGRHTIVLSTLLALALGLPSPQTALSSPRQDVVSALRDKDRLRSLEILRQKPPASTAASLLEVLEGSDQQLRGRAAWTLSLLPLKDSPRVARALARHLQHDSNASVRFCCAVGLMGSQTPQTRADYIQALDDKNERGATVA